MTETVYIPASFDEMRIKHLPFLLQLHDISHIPIDELDFKEVCRLNALITDVPESQLKRYTAIDNKRLLIKIIQTIGKYETKPCPSELNFNGVTYTFRGDFTKNPVDWADDLSYAEKSFSDNPIDIISFCYIEKGMSYGEPDEHQNPKNPRSKRNEVFREHLPLSTFLDIQAFFLLSYKELRLYLTRAKNQRLKRMLNAAASLNGNNLHSSYQSISH